MTEAEHLGTIAYWKRALIYPPLDWLLAPIDSGLCDGSSTNFPDVWSMKSTSGCSMMLVSCRLLQNTGFVPSELPSLSLASCSISWRSSGPIEWDRLLSLSSLSSSFPIYKTFCALFVPMSGSPRAVSGLEAKLCDCYDKSSFFDWSSDFGLGFEVIILSIARAPPNELPSPKDMFWLDFCWCDILSL